LLPICSSLPTPAPRPLRHPRCLARTQPPATPPLFPYTTLFRSRFHRGPETGPCYLSLMPLLEVDSLTLRVRSGPDAIQPVDGARSEEHTSELQSRENLVCRLLLEKKKRTPKGKPTACQAAIRAP